MIGGIAALRFGCTPRAGDLLCCLLTSETLARAGTPGQAGGPRGEGGAEGKRPGEVSVSTVLTSTLP